MSYSRAVYQNGSSLLLPYCQQLIYALQWEHETTLALIPKQQSISCFTATIVTIVDGFLEAVDAVVNRVRKSVQKRDTNEFAMLIDIWSGLDRLLAPHDGLLAACGAKGHDIQSSLNRFITTLLGYLGDFYDEFKTEESKRQQTAISVDGTVHEMTSMTMNTLKRIYEYEVGMESMIAKGHVATFRFSSLADFVSQLITALLEDIDIKSKNYKKPALANLFSLNNLHYIIKGIKGTKLAEAAGQKLIADMEKAIKKQIDMYRGSWMPLITVLVDETKISDKGKIVTVLSKQQRDVIKEKFKTFNKDFEEICTAQMKYAIPDVALRLQVINEVKAILLPMYNRFYDRYTASDNDFSKNPEKYIKFTKEQLSATMDKFFDASN